MGIYYEKEQCIFTIIFFNNSSYFICWFIMQRRFYHGASIDNNYNVQSIQSNSEEENQYPEDTYYIVYTPFTGGTNLTRISYLDTNTLNEMWKKTIRHGLNGDGRAWGIRDADNVHYDIRNGNYYYFDKNFDIVHTGNYGNRVKVKKFLGAI